MACGVARRSRVIALLFGSLAAFVAGATVVVDPAHESTPVGGAMRVTPDPGALLTIADLRSGRADAQTRTAAAHAPNLGYVRHPHWVRMRFDNAGDQALERILVLRRGSKHLQDIWVHAADGERHLRIGQGGSVSGDVQSRHAVVRLTLPARTTTDVTVRIDSRTGVALDYRLTSERALAQADALDLWLYGTLFGIGLAIGIYSLFVYAALRERIYLWFSGFALFGVIYQMHFEGFAFVGVWGHQQLLGNYVSLYTGVLYALFTVGFLRAIIDADRIMPRADRFLFKPIFVLLMFAFPLFPMFWWLANILAALGITAATLSLGGAALIAVWRGSVRVKTIPIAVVILAIAGTVFMLKQAGLIPDLRLFALLFPLTLGLAILAFAIALAERVRLIAADARRALKRHEAQLEKLVAERTAELSVAKDRAEAALEQLKATQNELVAAGKMASLGQLVAGVAHEINTPIGVAITAASFLVDRSDQVRHQLESGHFGRSELAAYVDDADQSASMVGSNLDRAAHLIKTFKQVSVDRSSDDRRTFKLGQYIRDLVESLEFTWRRRPVTLQIDCDEEIELDSFPGAFGQVLTNLIQNALLHAFDGERAGTMRLNARRIDATTIELRFEDNGCGVSAEALPHIFEPFYTTKRGHGGTGLGLHIVFNLVTAKLGGRIDVSSAPEEGLRFQLRIPTIAPA